MKLPWKLHTLDLPSTLPGNPEGKFFDLRDADNKRIFTYTAIGKDDIARYTAMFDLIVAAVNTYPSGMDGNKPTYDHKK